MPVTWKEVTVTYFKVLQRYLLEELRTITKTLGRNSLSSGRDLNSGSPENEAKAEVLTIRSRIYIINDDQIFTFLR
jgi:hypothetical protein